MISRFFIDRPVFAAVIAIMIVLAGLISIKGLPIAQYPNILPPTVSVATTYLGASAEVIANTVASPLEEQINGVENMLYITSTSSSSGQLNITVTFAIGTDPAQAEIDVNNRVQKALVALPNEVQQAGVTVNRASGTLLEVVALFSPNKTFNTLFISNYALLNVIDNLKRVPGVGNAGLFGATNYAMRIWLKPDKMAQYNLVPNDIKVAIQEQNSQFALGKFADEPMQNAQSYTYPALTQGRFSTEKEFEEIIIKTQEDGGHLLLKDIARIELGAENYNFISTLNGKPAVMLGIYLDSAANALQVVQAVEQEMKKLSQDFPEGISYSIPFDTTVFVKISIKELVKTFLEAILLVMGVVYLFLQNGRATIIPLLAIPISLIGTFAGMYLFGFSINLLTLFGLILAIGIVVDDAIIVLENVERIMREENLPPREAAIKSMEEVSGPIIAIVLILTAVFLPVAFIGGISGLIYQQFALTMITSIVLSGIVALILTPSLCAHFIRTHEMKENKFFHNFNYYFDQLTYKYTQVVEFFLKHVRLGLLIFTLAIIGMIIAFKYLPSGLVPDEDQGYLIAVQNLMPGTSLKRTNESMQQLITQLKENPEINNVVGLSGLDLLGGMGLKTSSSAAFITLKTWDQRNVTGGDSFSLAKKFAFMANQIKEAITLTFNPPPISGMSTTGGVEFYIQYKGSEKNYTSLLLQTGNKLVQALQKRPEILWSQTMFSASTPAYNINLNRTKAKALKVNVNDFFNAMQSTFGTYYINDFSLFGRTYKVYMQSDASYRENVENLKDVFVRSINGNMIPLSSLLRVDLTLQSDTITRYNIFPAAKIMGTPAAGYSSGQAIQAINQTAKEVLGNDFAIGWVGASYQEEISSHAGNTALIFGIIAIFLILAALYEKWTLPLAVIAAIPFAVLGAIISQLLRGLANDVYFQVGLLTLIGLAAKNAILIIEFAVLEMQNGASVYDAARKAAQLRFRPIIMTSLAFILGCLPLFFSSGAGAASRHSISTGIIGGMLVATFIATFFIPLFFKLITRSRNQSHR